MNKKIEKTFQKIDKIFRKTIKNVKKSIIHTKIQPIDNESITPNTSYLIPIIHTQPKPQIQSQIKIVKHETIEDDDEYMDAYDNSNYSSPTFDFIVPDDEFRDIIINTCKTNENLKYLISTIEDWIIPELKTLGFKTLIIPHARFKGQFADSDLHFNVSERWSGDWHYDKYCLFVIRLEEDHTISLNLPMYVEHSKLNIEHKKQLYQIFQLYLPKNTYLFDYDPKWNKLEIGEYYIYLLYEKQGTDFEIPVLKDKFPSLSVICDHKMDIDSSTTGEIFDELIKLSSDNCDMCQHTISETEFDIRYFNINNVDDFVSKITKELDNLYNDGHIHKYYALLQMFENDIGQDYRSKKINNENNVSSYLNYMYDFAKSFTSGINF